MWRHASARQIMELRGVGAAEVADAKAQFEETNPFPRNVPFPRATKWFGTTPAPRRR